MLFTTRISVRQILVKIMGMSESMSQPAQWMPLERPITLMVSLSRCSFSYTMAFTIIEQVQTQDRTMNSGNVRDTAWINLFTANYKLLFNNGIYQIISLLDSMSDRIVNAFQLRVVIYTTHFETVKRERNIFTANQQTAQQ